MTVANTPVVREKVRDSNIELLRIIAMLLVMIVHASFFSLNSPSVIDVKNDISSSFFRCLSESLTIICVDVFVLISGWFGIRVKLIRLSEFIFQVYFFGILMYVASILMGTDYISIKGLGKLFLSKDLWFVKSYIVLYIFAPILNTFVENSNKKDLGIFLIAFFVVQTLHGFISGSSWFSGGYSPLTFMGLYLLARYIRLYPNKLVQLNKFSDLTIYLSIALFTAALTLLSIMTGHETWHLYSYSSPLVIIEALYFFLFFTKIRLRNKLINWIAISSFAVYLFHCDVHFLVPVYSTKISLWYHTYPTITFILYVAVWIVCIFTISILVDKVRIVIWNLCLKLYTKNKAHSLI